MPAGRVMPASRVVGGVRVSFLMLHDGFVNRSIASSPHIGSLLS